MYAILLALGRKSCDCSLEEGIRIAAWDSRPVVGSQWGEARLDLKFVCGVLRFAGAGVREDSR